MISFYDVAGFSLWVIAAVVVFTLVRKDIKQRRKNKDIENMERLD